jgi:hypothetical protein
LTSSVELRVVGLFHRDIHQALSIHSISKKLGKSYPHIYHACMRLSEEGVLKSVRMGRSHICSLNLMSDKLIALLTLLDVQRQSDMNLFRLQSLVKNASRDFKLLTVFHDSKNIVIVLDHLHDEDALKRLYPEMTKLPVIFTDEEGFLRWMSRTPSIDKFTVLHSYDYFYRSFSAMGEAAYARGASR